MNRTNRPSGYLPPRIAAVKSRSNRLKDESPLVKTSIAQAQPVANKSKKPVDLLAIIGPNFPMQTPANILEGMAGSENDGLSIYFVRHDDQNPNPMPKELADDAHVFLFAHGNVRNSHDSGSKGGSKAGSRRHVLNLYKKDKEEDTVSELTRLRRRYKNWRGFCHVDSCLGGFVRKTLNRDAQKELGLCLLHAGATYPSMSKGDALEPLIKYLRFAKKEGLRPSPLTIFALVQAKTEECLTGIGKEFGGCLIVHSPKEPEAATSEGLQKLISEKVTPLSARTADVKPQVVGGAEVLKALSQEIDRLRKDGWLDGCDESRMRAGLMFRLRTRKINKLTKWLDSDSNFAAWSNSGEPLLHAAVAHQLPVDMITRLLTRGADVNAVDDKGRTPLHYAAAYSDTKTVTLLLIAGATLDIEDGSGRTPLYYARENEHVGVEAILTEEASKRANGPDPTHTDGEASGEMAAHANWWGSESEDEKDLKAPTGPAQGGAKLRPEDEVSTRAKQPKPTRADDEASGEMAAHANRWGSESEDEKDLEAPTLPIKGDWEDPD